MRDLTSDEAYARNRRVAEDIKERFTEIEHDKWLRALIARVVGQHR